MKPIDPFQLQRLVDGELNDQQVRQILVDAQASPDQWQEIAVGFVENQSWCGAFKNESENELELTVPAAKSDRVDLPSFKFSTRKQSEKLQPVRPTNYPWLVIAASLLVTGLIGYMVGQIENRSLPMPSMAESKHQPNAESLLADNSASVVTPKITQADYRTPDYHLEVPEEQLGDLDAGPVAPVPLYTVTNAQQLEQLNLQQKTPSLPSEVLEQLAGSGYQMEQAVDFISGRLGDGRSFVVPVRTVRFVPGQ